MVENVIGVLALARKKYIAEAEPLVRVPTTGTQVLK
jgi:hypothetical protein